MKPTPPGVKSAIATLQSAMLALGEAAGNGYGGVPVVPGDASISSPQPTTIRAVDVASALHVPLPGATVPWPVVRWPPGQYHLWEQAWNTLAAYAGWWGRRANWPLGDGQAALVDPKVARRLPPILGAMPVLQAVLTTVAAPTWIPDVNPWAIGAPIIFLGGLATAAIQGANWYARKSEPGYRASAKARAANRSSRAASMATENAKANADYEAAVAKSNAVIEARRKQAAQ